MTTGTLLPGQQVARRRTRQNEWVKSLVGDILALLIGLASCYTVTLVGGIPLCEFILLPCLPLFLIVNSGRLRLRKRMLGMILCLLMLWLLGQVVTDLYRSTPRMDWLRGQTNIVVFALDLIGFSILLKGNQRRQMIFLFGLAIGSGLSGKLQPTLQGEGMALKFAYSLAGLYFALWASSLFYRRGQHLIAGLFVLGDLVFSVVFNFRSIVLQVFVAACLVFPIIPEWIGRVRILPPAGTRARVFTIIAIALISGSVTGKVMTALAASGALGHEAQAKNQNQTQTGSESGLGILLGGRPEILVSSQAVWDSPILGHGSWAKDPKYRRMLLDIESEYGVKVVNEEQNTDYLIPAHSHLMGSWVDAGILGAVFWIYIFVLACKALIRAVMSQVPVKPAYVTLVVIFLWDILFSPFGGLRRVTVSFILVIICDILDPDSSVRKIAVQAYRHVQVPLHTRNLGRISPGFRAGL
jgi:hypothetical protein